ncbi:hypothetical protein ACR3K2_22740 [Cryptosporidium serpentis]
MHKRDSNQNIYKFPGSGFQEDRFNRLNQRLNSIHTGFDIVNDKNPKFVKHLNEIESRISDVNNELNAKYQTEIRHIDQLRGLIINDTDGYDDFTNEKAPNTNSNNFNTLMASNILQAESRLNQILENEILNRKNLECRLIDIINDRMDHLQSEITRRDAEREELDACVKRFVDFDIPRLSDAIRNEIDKCQSSENELLKKIEVEFTRLHEMIEDEIKIRQQSIDALLDLMENLVQQITLDARNDRSDRQASEDILMKLLEETLTRIQAATQSLYKEDNSLGNSSINSKYLTNCTNASQNNSSFFNVPMQDNINTISNISTSPSSLPSNIMSSINLSNSLSSNKNSSYNLPLSYSKQLSINLSDQNNANNLSYSHCNSYNPANII